MPSATADRALTLGYHVIAALTIAHALVVSLLWVGVFYFDFIVIAGRAWVILFWLWFIWPAMLLLHPSRSTRRVLWPSLVGIALLAECFPTVWSYTAWSATGFAP